MPRERNTGGGRVFGLPHLLQNKDTFKLSRFGGAVYIYFSTILIMDRYYLSS